MSLRWKSAVSLDLRSLAMFRALLGAYLLTDVMLRLNSVNIFYTDDGFLPREALLGLVPTPWLLSLHLSSGGMIIHGPLFLAAVFCAAGVLIGYRTRAATIVSWILFASMHARNPLVDGLAEDIVLGLLFWAMFVPLDARWSLDAALNPEHRRRENPYASVAVVALLLQLGFVYWFAPGLHAKELFPAWLPPRLITPLRIAGPVLVFLPLATGAIRLATAAVFLILHLAAAATLGSPWAPLISAAAWVLVLPGGFWDTIAIRVARGRSLDAALDSVVAKLRNLTRKWPAWLRRRLDPKPAGRELGTLGRAIVLGALALSLSGYVSHESGSSVKLPPAADAVATMVQLGQPWTGSPRTTREQGWYVIEGVYVSGRREDLLRGAPIEWAAPSGDIYHDRRVERYLMWLRDPSMAPYVKYFAGSFCRRWNARNPQSPVLSAVHVNYMQRQPDGTVNKLFLLQESCPK